MKLDDRIKLFFPEELVAGIGAGTVKMVDKKHAKTLLRRKLAVEATEDQELKIISVKERPLHEIEFNSATQTFGKTVNKNVPRKPINTSAPILV